jgi:hypothetical protein
MINENAKLDFFLHEGLLVNEDTGEIITRKEYHEEFSEPMKDHIRKYVESCLAIGEKPKFAYQTIKNINTAVVPVKEHYHFNKVFRMDMNNLMLSGDLSKEEITFLGFIQGFVSFPNNDIVFSNQYLSIEEIAKLIKMNRNSLGKAIKTLEKRQVIKVITRHMNPPIIYFNPFLIATGRVIAIETYNMFKDSVYNPKTYLDDDED